MQQYEYLVTEIVTRAPPTSPSSPSPSPGILVNPLILCHCFALGGDELVDRGVEVWKQHG